MECWNCKGIYQDEAFACSWCGAPKKKPESTSSSLSHPPPSNPPQPPQANSNEERKKKVSLSRIVLLLVLIIGGFIVIPQETQRQIMRWFFKDERARAGLGLLVPLPKIVQNKCEQIRNPNGDDSSGTYHIRLMAKVKNEGKSGRVKLFFILGGRRAPARVIYLRHDDEKIVEQTMRTRKKRFLCEFRVEPY